MKKIFLLLSINLLACSIVGAYDLSLRPLVIEWPADGEIEHLFRIENMNYETGESYSLEVNLSYNITSNESTLLEGNSTHTINKYTTNTAGFSFNTSVIHRLLICGNISSENDSIQENNFGCWELQDETEEEEEENNESNQNETETHEEENEEETLCEEMMITGIPNLSESGERILYRFEPWEAGDEVSYWWENIWGEIVKNEVVTTRNSERSYTPRTKKEQEALILHALRYREGCQESQAQKIVVLVGEQAHEEEEENEEEYEDSLEIISITDNVDYGEAILLEIEASKKDNRVRVIVFEAAGVKAKIRLKEKGNYEMSIPLTLPCGTWNLQVEGLGEEETYEVEVMCEEEEKTCEEKEKETTRVSAYVLAKKWNEEIKLFGTLEGKGYVCKLEEKQEIEGTFTSIITPHAGANTYAIIRERETGIAEGKILRFELEKEEEKKTNINTSSTNNTTTNNSSNSITTQLGTSISLGNKQNSITGKTIALEQKSKKPLFYAGGLVILLGIGLLLKNHRNSKQTLKTTLKKYM